MLSFCKMGKVKKVTVAVETKPNVLSKGNKISKDRPGAKKTVMEKVRKTLGLKNPKKSTLKPDQDKLAEILQNNALIKVSKKTKQVKGATVKKEKPSKGIKRKKSSASDEKVSTPGKYVKPKLEVEDVPAKQTTSRYEKLEKRYKIEGGVVQSAFQAVQKLLNQKAEKSNKLFDDEQPIFLQIGSVKVPKCPPRIARIPVKHSLFTGLDVCFIAADVDGIPKTEPELVKEHYEKLFAKNGVQNIKTVIPLHELVTEYGEFELKRRLVELYDVFLVDGRISGKVVHFLGKIFYQKRKVPAPVKLNTAHLKRQIQKSLLKTAFYIKPNGDSFIIQVCHSKMNENQMIDNFWSVVKGLSKEFPGGWENIKNLHLKGTNTLSVPVYVNLVSRNEVKTPIIKQKRPKAFVPVSDELSTKLNRKVTVLPTGEVYTEPIDSKKDAVDSASEDEVEDDLSNEEESKKVPKEKDSDVSEDEESDEENPVEYSQEEISYLQNMEDKKSGQVKNKKGKRSGTKKSVAKRKKQ